MLEQEIFDGDLPCISRSNMDSGRCHVYSWGNGKNSVNSMKIDNVEVFTKGECYTSHLINGKRHEKYVSKGNNNICVGSQNQYELDIVRLFFIDFKSQLFNLFLHLRTWAGLRWRVTKKLEVNRRCWKDFWHGQRRSISTHISSLTSHSSLIGLSRPSTRNIWTRFEKLKQLRKWLNKGRETPSSIDFHFFFYWIN